MAFEPVLDGRQFLLDHDEGPLRLGQFRGHVAADAADAADDVVPAQGGDLALHVASPEGGVEVGLDQQRQEGREQVAEVGDADDGDRDREQAADRVVREVDRLAEADGGHGDEGHVEAVDPARIGAADEVVAERAHEMQDGQQQGACHQAPEVTVADDSAEQ